MSSHLQMNTVAFYLNSVLLGIGIVGNAVAFVVFLNKTLRKRKFYWYLITLTVFEFLFCLTCFIDYIFMKIYKRELFLHSIHKISFMIVDYTIHTSDCCTVILTLLLSTDRLVAIKNPMKFREFITNLHAKKTIIVSLFSIILLKTLSFGTCELNFSNKPFIFYCSIVSPVFFYVVPSIVVLFLNGMLAKEMCYVNEQISESYGIEINQLNAVTALIYVDINNTRKVSTAVIKKFSKRKTSKAQKLHYIFIFILSLWSTLTSIPYYLFYSYFSLSQLNIISNKFNLEILTTIQSTSSIFFNSNHCINFFIYLSFYIEFRNILKSSCLKLFPK